MATAGALPASSRERDSKNPSHEEELLALTSILGEEIILPTEEEDEFEYRMFIEVDVEEKEDDSLQSKDFECDFSIEFLPPLLLKFTLCEDYPETSQPPFSLVCGWLNGEQLEAVKARMEEMWREEYRGIGVLYAWHQEIKENVLNIAGKKLDLTPEKLHQLKKYNEVKKLEAFRTSLQICEICYMEVEGKELIELPTCGHSFCRECLSIHCKTKMAEGRHNGLKCPDPHCEYEGLIDGSTLKDVLDSETFAQFDKRMLEFAIRTMSGTAWCPRKDCSQMAASDEEQGLGECQVCHFVFCLKCEKTYHGRNLCKQEEERLEAEKEHQRQIDEWRRRREA